MKTSELIEKNARELQSLFRLNPTPAHRHEVLEEIQGLVNYTAQFAPETRKHGASLVDVATRYYGENAVGVSHGEHDELMRSMRTFSVLIATASSSHRLAGD